jgi:ligand-binding sensor domain-containing protein/DNA-binding CsgD family transcriptional regulator
MNHFRIKIIFISLLFIIPTFSISQGLPFISNFEKGTYQGGTQNWEITCHENGVLLVANNDGLLEYDGYSWRKYPVKNQTIVRSVLLDKENKVYVGAQGEFGYFAQKNNSTKSYFSFQKQFDSLGLNLEDIWDIVQDNKGTIYFYSGRKLFNLKKGKLSYNELPSDISYLGFVNNQLFIQCLQEGLFKLDDKENIVFLTDIAAKEGPVTKIMPFHKTTLLVTTLEGSVYFLNNNNLRLWLVESHEYLKRNKIYTATLLNNGQFALGTSRGGVVIMDKKGKTQFILNKSNGLINNNVLSLFNDKQGNLWAGTDNGISCIQLIYPFTYLFPDENMGGTAYSAIKKGKDFYFGTVNGLYKHTAEENGSLANSIGRLVPNTEGQVWQVQSIGKEIWIGHHLGAFVLNENKESKHILKNTGAWIFKEIAGNKNKLLCGTYDGVHVLENKKGSWMASERLPAFEESSRIMVQESNYSFWIAHPYRGIFNLELNEPNLLSAQIKYFNSKQKLPSNNGNSVFTLQNQAVFTTENGIYRYDPIQLSFFPYTLLNQVFGTSTKVKTLKEGFNGTIWFAQGDDVGYLVRSKNEKDSVVFKKKQIPYLKNKLVGGFEFIYPYEKDKVLFGTDKGFLFYNEKIQNKYPDKILCRHFTFDENLNSATFEYALPYLSQSLNVKYTTKLEGFEKTWKTWTTENKISYSNLPPGDYQFLVKANVDGLKTWKPLQYSFTVNPPWYLSRGFKFFYLFIVILAIFLLLFIPRKRFDREKKLMVQKLQKKTLSEKIRADKALEDIVRLENEKLQLDNDTKNQELASTTLHLLQKNELIQDLSTKLSQISKSSKEKETKQAIDQLLNKVASDHQMDEDWEIFALHFNQVHLDFLHRIVEKYPDITPKDQKLCAFLRMNLSSKEIAPLLGISIRGVEISRYRLRKKLHLSADDNLSTFILHF